MIFVRTSKTPLSPKRVWKRKKPPDESKSFVLISWSLKLKSFKLKSNSFSFVKSWYSKDPFFISILSMIICGSSEVDSSFFSSCVFITSLYSINEKLNKASLREWVYV